ncbi:MAG TPA: HEAT repeat domain-containing protein [Vicinamibacteria bacterium]
MRRPLFFACVMVLIAHGSAWAQADPDRLRAAKELVFDKKHAEARAAWEQVLATASGAEAETAAYWVARCSENLGESERALREYARFLDRRPADRALAEEARTSRVGLAAKLVKAGQRQHLAVLTAALTDPSKTVRYYAALQLAGLGKEQGAPALPVLKDILAHEKDDDLVERAKLALLRLDPRALAEKQPEPRPAAKPQALVPAAPAAPPAPPAKAAPRPLAPGSRATWIRVRVYEKGEKQPEVSINLPLGLAELVFKSLPDDARSELRRKGIDADNFWDRLMQLGPSEILSIEGQDGERVQIWLE